jgi:ABC-type transporter Mla MlaB component
MHGTVDIETSPGVIVLMLRGDQCVSAEPRLRKAIDEAVSAGLSVVIDVSEVGLIDSAVLATIQDGQQRATNGDGDREHGLAAVASPGARFVARMLSLVHVDEHAVHHSRDSAVVSVGRSPVA